MVHHAGTLRSEGSERSDEIDSARFPYASAISDKAAFAIATLGGVGYLPIVPATWGSLATAALHFLFQFSLERTAVSAAIPHITSFSYEAIVKAAMTVLIVLLFLIGTWAASRVAKITGRKDPRIVVIDEVVGQLITFLLLPASVGWIFILLGFLTFRFFDIWKPFPARQLEDLSSGLGIMADDVMAGLYSAGFLWIVYSVSV